MTEPRTLAALADRTRRELIAALAQSPSSSTELAEMCGISRQAVEKQLRVLAGCGLVVARPAGGRRVEYVLDTSPIEKAGDWLRALASDLDRARAIPAPLSANALDALDTEVRRTARERRSAASSTKHPSTKESA